MTDHPIERILRRPSVLDANGYSRSTLYVRISQGLYPRPVALGPRSVGWPAGEVAALNAARIAGKTDDEIRGLVAQLLAARCSAVGETRDAATPISGEDAAAHSSATRGRPLGGACDR